MSIQTEAAATPPRHTGFPSDPRVANAHLFRAGARHMLFSVDSGQIFEIDEILAHTLDRTMEYGDSDRVGQFLAAAGLPAPVGPDEPPASVPLRGLSLAVAQKCNLGCTYCYAQQGDFGGPAAVMGLEVARAAIHRLFEDVGPGENVSLAFLGGEPLAGRAVLRAATEYAAGRAAAAGVRVAFAVTTNATLLTDDDADFFDRHRFTVTVSIDGVGEVHDRLRPFKSGRGSYDRVVERCLVMLSRPARRTRVTARVSVTPRNLGLTRTLEQLIDLGFDGVLFSPVLSSPTGTDQMGSVECEAMLTELIACGRMFERQLRETGTVYPFLNVLNTLRRIHERRRDAYPCGAGGGYLGVSAAGGLYACHRFVDDDLGAMGDLAGGVDPARQRVWLTQRHVGAQEPCRTCWARHLCGGGCHHEVIHRGRPACNSIRGWLHYCLELYATFSHDDPALLAGLLDARGGP